MPDSNQMFEKSSGKTADFLLLLVSPDLFYVCEKHHFITSRIISLINSFKSQMKF